MVLYCRRRIKLITTWHCGICCCSLERKLTKNKILIFKKFDNHHTHLLFVKPINTCKSTWWLNLISINCANFLFSKTSKSMRKMFKVFIYFKGCSTLHDLQSTLENQSLYVELLQELSPGHSVVLATFETSVLEFLFPYPQLRPTYTSGVDVDLLMEPTRDFPGIISPKVTVFFRN